MKAAHIWIAASVLLVSCAAQRAGGDPDSQGMMRQMHGQMQEMHAHMDEIRKAQDPQEKQRLMGEQMERMQHHMRMMQDMMVHVQDPDRMKGPMMEGGAQPPPKPAESEDHKSHH